MKNIHPLAEDWKKLTYVVTAETQIIKRKSSRIRDSSLVVSHQYRTVFLDHVVSNISCHTSYVAFPAFHLESKRHALQIWKGCPSCGDFAWAHLMSAIESLFEWDGLFPTQIARFSVPWALTAFQQSVLLWDCVLFYFVVGDGTLFGRNRVPWAGARSGNWWILARKFVQSSKDYWDRKSVV